MMEERTFLPGEIVQHFKRELLSEEERETNKYLYKIVGKCRYASAKRHDPRIPRECTCSARGNHNYREHEYTNELYMSYLLGCERT